MSDEFNPRFYSKNPKPEIGGNRRSGGGGRGLRGTDVNIRRNTRGDSEPTSIAADNVPDVSLQKVNSHLTLNAQLRHRHQDRNNHRHQNLRDVADVVGRGSPVYTSWMQNTHGRLEVAAPSIIPQTVERLGNVNSVNSNAMTSEKSSSTMIKTVG